MPSHNITSASDYHDGLTLLIEDEVRRFYEEVDHINWQVPDDINFVPDDLHNRLLTMSDEGIISKVLLYKKRTRLISLLYGVVFACISGIGVGLFFGLMALGVTGLYNRIWAKNLDGKDYAFCLLLPLVAIILFSIFAEFIGKLVGTLLFVIFLILVFLFLIKGIFS